MLKEARQEGERLLSVELEPLDVTAARVARARDVVERGCVLTRRQQAQRKACVTVRLQTEQVLDHGVDLPIEERDAIEASLVRVPFETEVEVLRRVGLQERIADRRGLSPEG